MLPEDEDLNDMEAFDAEIDANGCAATIADDGIIIGFNIDKLNELLELAAKSPVGKVAISMPFNDDDSIDPDMLN